ncbi:hypothetical protein BDV26DRAFT_266574 [Aspergillus bertholletiae]|uniref:Uncharacterized protein n=1 Tax=Aspergillus bertholletiae TaxID=1226010 RepID=A0A5N7B1V9_9EURO|nr:hypothetical protein BDV26DRAFT_266574 [Aspergillus bertholletiae]
MNREPGIIILLLVLSSLFPMMVGNRDNHERLTPYWEMRNETERPHFNVYITLSNQTNKRTKLNRSLG